MIWAFAIHIIARTLIPLYYAYSVYSLEELFVQMYLARFFTYTFIFWLASTSILYLFYIQSTAIKSPVDQAVEDLDDYDNQSNIDENDLYDGDQKLQMKINKQLSPTAKQTIIKNSQFSLNSRSNSILSLDEDIDTQFKYFLNSQVCLK